MTFCRGIRLELLVDETQQHVRLNLPFFVIYFVPCESGQVIFRWRRRSLWNVLRFILKSVWNRVSGTSKFRLALVSVKPVEYAVTEFHYFLRIHVVPETCKLAWHAQRKTLMGHSLTYVTLQKSKKSKLVEQYSLLFLTGVSCVMFRKQKNKQDAVAECSKLRPKHRIYKNRRRSYAWG